VQKILAQKGVVPPPVAPGDITYWLGSIHAIEKPTTPGQVVYVGARKALYMSSTYDAAEMWQGQVTAQNWVYKAYRTPTQLPPHSMNGDIGLICQEDSAWLLPTPVDLPVPTPENSQPDPVSVTMVVRDLAGNFSNWEVKMVGTDCDAPQGDPPHRGDQSIFSPGIINRPPSFQENPPDQAFQIEHASIFAPGEWDDWMGVGSAPAPWVFTGTEEGWGYADMVELFGPSNPEGFDPEFWGSDGYAEGVIPATRGFHASEWGYLHRDPESPFSLAECAPGLGRVIVPCTSIDDISLRSGHHYMNVAALTPDVVATGNVVTLKVSAGFLEPEDHGAGALRLENFEANGDYVRFVGPNGTDLTAWAPKDSRAKLDETMITILRMSPPAGATRSDTLMQGLVPYSPADASLCQTLEVTVHIGSEVPAGLYNLDVKLGRVHGYKDELSLANKGKNGAHRMKEALNIVKIEFVDLDGEPIHIINPLGSHLVDDAIAYQDAAVNDPMVTMYSNPLFMQFDLPPTLRPNNSDTITAHLRCRATGQELSLTLREQTTPLCFADDANEFQVALMRPGADGFCDDPLSPRAALADNLAAQIMSTKFGRTFAGGVQLYETSLSNRKFRNRSLAGSASISGLRGPGRTLQLNAHRDALTLVATLTETGPDAFGNTNCQVQVFPTLNSGSSRVLSPDGPDKLLAIVTAPAQGIQGEVMLLYETGANTLAFEAKVEPDSVLCTTTTSGQPRPPATPTLDELDDMVEQYKAYKVRVSGLPPGAPPPNCITIRSLDPNDRVKHSIEIPLVPDTGGGGAYTTDQPVLPFDGPPNDSLEARYGDDYKLLVASQHEVLVKEMKAKLPTLRSVMFIGDSLGAGMQSVHMYDGLEQKGFASLLARAFGWKYQSPCFMYYQLWPERYGWPAGPYKILVDQPTEPAQEGQYWGSLHLDKSESGFKPGDRVYKDINNFSVPGFEIQNLRRTSGAPKKAEKGENPGGGDMGIWGDRLAVMNEKILGARNPVQEVMRALSEGTGKEQDGRLPRPCVIVVSVGGNDLLESVTSKPYGDPDCVIRKDMDGLNPHPSNVAWDATKCDAPLVNGGKPAGYDSLDFGEYVTRVSIFRLELERILDDIDSAWPTFGEPRLNRDKPLVILTKVPDLSRLPLLLPVARGKANARPIGRLPYSCQLHPFAGPYNFMEYITYYVSPTARGSYANARVSLAAIVDKALISPASEFRRLKLCGQDGKTQYLVLTGGARLDPVELSAADVLSDGELSMMRQHQSWYNSAIDAVVAANAAGGWPHIRVIAVDMNRAFSPPSFPPFLSNLNLSPTGGVISLDLVHPNSTGHRLLANEYIQRINALIMADQFFWLPTDCVGSLYQMP
jgi:hypothetical protein